MRWSKPLGRAALAAVLAVGALASSVTTVAAQTAPEARPTADDTVGDAAILDLVGCIQGSRRLAAVFLIDESQSLQVTDPDDRRVDAAQAALDGLASLAEGSGDQRTAVDVTFAAFADRYRPVRGWTRLVPANESRLDQAVDSFRTRNEGIDTDFVNALAGARKTLADRSAALTGRGEPAPCKAVFFFTDGEYDVTVRTAKTVARLGRTKPYAPGVSLESEAGVDEAEAAGRDELCRPGGLADGLRGEDITLLTLALAQSIPPEAQAFLTAVTAGSSGDVTCGTPTGTPPGAYLGAGDVDLLIARFDEVAARVAGGTVVPDDEAITLCGADACEAGARTVQLDASVRRLRLLALAPEPGLAVRVSGPAGEATIAEAGTSNIGAVRARATQVADRGLSIDLDRPSEAADWNGAWTITVLDPSGEHAGDPATVQVYVFSDFGIALGDVAGMTRGEAVTLDAELVVPEGLDGTQLATADVAVRLDDPLGGSSETVALTGPPTGPFTGTFTPPADYTTSAYDLSVELRARTKDGADVVARGASRSITVRRPQGSVQFVPNRLDLPTLTGAGSTEGELVFVGGGADGCVWFGAGEQTAPAAAGEVALSFDGRTGVSEDECIAVPAEGSVSVPVRLTPENRTTGAVRGVLEVNTKVDGAEANVTRVPYQVDLAVGIDQARRLVLAGLLLAAGLLVPLLLLLAINALTARFQALDAIQGAVLPVRTQSGEIFRTDGSRAVRLALRTSDFRSLQGSGGSRRFSFGGVEFRARASRNPFGGAEALGAPEGGAERLKGRVGSKVALDLGLAGSWLFLLDPDRTRRAGPGAAEGNLIAFLAAGDATEQLQRMQGDIDRRLEGTAAELAGLVRGKRVSARSAKRAAARAASADPGDASEQSEPATGQPEAVTGDEAVTGGGPSGDAPDPADGTPSTGSPSSSPSAGRPPAGFTGGGAATPPPAAPPTSEERPAGPPTGFTGGGATSAPADPQDD